MIMMIIKTIMIVICTKQCVAIQITTVLLLIITFKTIIIITILIMIIILQMLNQLHINIGEAVVLCAVFENINEQWYYIHHLSSCFYPTETRLQPVRYGTILIIVFVTPNPPTKSFNFEGFDSSKLLILRGGNYHARRI